MNTAKSNNKQDSPGIFIIPPTVFFTCLILGAILEFLLPGDFPIYAPSVRIFLGLCIGGAGFAFMSIAHKTFEKTDTNVCPKFPATTLVEKGVYVFSRNPMYVGGSAFYLGICLLIGSLWMLFFYIPLGLYIAFHVVPREEAYMERTFGEAYRVYCRRVARWL